MKKPAWNRRTKRVLLIGGLLLCGALLVAACQVQEVKISYPYICSNGTPADGQSLLPNVIRCASCDDLYRLVDQGCVANGYSCQNGTPRTGTPPGNANIELCVRCESGFKLEGARCIATTYTCTGGVPVSGSPPGNRDVERCARCTIAESYPDPATGFCATEFPYICTDGSPAPGMNGTPNTERCINCNSGYHPDGDLCAINSYTCSNGVAMVDGTAGGTHQQDFCASCNSGYHPDGALCSANTYTCTNGTPAVDGTAGGTHQQDFCASCDSTYKLGSDNLCTERTAYTCSNGTPQTGRPSGNDDEEQCTNCDAFYTLDSATTTCVLPDPFITVWRTTRANEDIRIPTAGSGYNYLISCGAGSTQGAAYRHITSNLFQTCTYRSPGDHEVRIVGTFPRIALGGSDSNNANDIKLREVRQWGDIEWQSMASAFENAEYLSITATDSPDLSSVTDMRDTFRDARYFNSNISGWDVSNATTMSGMFAGAGDFNQDVGGWNTANVTDMSEMFSHAYDFNKDISGWNTSEVTTMSSMFAWASSFNQNIAYNSTNGTWNTAKVTDMDYMFWTAFVFNHDISNWLTTALTTADDMFAFTDVFDCAHAPVKAGVISCP